MNPTHPIPHIQGDRDVSGFEGNEEACHEMRRKKLGDKAAQPHRVR